MRLLMESTPREHEKRTLSAHLECRDVRAREANVKPFCGTSHLKKEAILGLTVRARITGKPAHFVVSIGVDRKRTCPCTGTTSEGVLC